MVNHYQTSILLFPSIFSKTKYNNAHGMYHPIFSAFRWLYSFNIYICTSDNSILKRFPCIFFYPVGWCWYPINGEINKVPDVKPAVLKCTKYETNKKKHKSAVPKNFVSICFWPHNWRYITIYLRSSFRGAEWMITGAEKHHPFGFQHLEDSGKHISLGIQSPCQRMIGVYNRPPKSKVFSFHETILSFGEQSDP